MCGGDGGGRSNSCGGSKVAGSVDRIAHAVSPPVVRQRDSSGRLAGLCARTVRDRSPSSPKQAVVTSCKARGFFPRPRPYRRKEVVETACLYGTYDLPHVCRPNKCLFECDGKTVVSRRQLLKGLVSVTRGKKVVKKMAVHQVSNAAQIELCLSLGSQLFSPRFRR